MTSLKLKMINYTAVNTDEEIQNIQYYIHITVQTYLWHVSALMCHLGKTWWMSNLLWQWSWSFLIHYPRNCLEETRKQQINICWDCLPLRPPTYEIRVNVQSEQTVQHHIIIIKLSPNLSFPKCGENVVLHLVLGISECQ